MPRSLVRTWCLAVLVTACSDGSPTATPDNSTGTKEPASGPPGLVVSDISGSLTTTAYVSAAPGTFSDISSLVIRNLTIPGSERPTAIVDGGFDPVAISAQAGDQITLEFSPQSGRGPVSIRVPAQRQPGIVRMVPSSGQTSVGLASPVVVVFTEPINEASLTTRSLAVAHDGASVTGIVTISSDHLSATFTPQGYLLPKEKYDVSVTSDISDLDGEHLELPKSVSFTTSADSGVPIMSDLVGTLAFVSLRDGGVPHIYVSKPDGSDQKRLTNLNQPEVTPVWSHDGKKLAFTSNENTYVINRDGSGLTKLSVGGHWPSWSPDGKQVLLATSKGWQIIPADGSTGDDVIVEPIGKPTGDFAGSTANDGFSASWSPDGRRIAFSAWTSYDFERAFIMNVDGSAPRTFVGVVHGAYWDECGPVWSPDGSRIALLGGVFGGTSGIVGTFAVGIVNPETGDVNTIAVTGTTCWDATYSSENSFSGVAWSPDQRTLAITRRNPSWNSQPIWTGPKESNIAIVDIATKAVRLVIADAYDPAWSQLQ